MIDLTNADRESIEAFKVDFDRLNADSRLREIVDGCIDKFELFFDTFNRTVFNKDIPQVYESNTGFHPDSILTLFIRHSAVSFGGLNLQHCVVAFHHELGKFELDNFKYLIGSLYADVSDASVRQFTNLYSDEILDIYEHKNDILRYLRMYVIENVTPYMNTSEMFDALMCTQLKVPSVERFIDSIKPGNVNQKEEEFIECFKNICTTYRFLISFKNQLYAIHHTMYNYQKHNYQQNLSFMKNWTNNNRIANAAKRVVKCSQFYVQYSFERNNKYMTATSVGLFCSITGLYASRTTLVRINKGRFCVVWPFGRDLVPYANQNLDVLHSYRIAKRVTVFARDNVDELFVKFQFISAVMNIDGRWSNSLSETVTNNFFELLEDHKTLPGALPVVEFFPYKLQIVVYVLTLLKRGLRTLLDYRKLYRILFDNVVNATHVSRDDWMQNYRTVMGVNFSKMITIHRCLQTQDQILRTLNN